METHAVIQPKRHAFIQKNVQNFKDTLDLKFISCLTIIYKEIGRVRAIFHCKRWSNVPLGGKVFCLINVSMHTYTQTKRTDSIQTILILKI